MPSVSILIPAFRPTYLRQAIASALTQGIEDFEIIVSDDSAGPDIRPIVEQFRDPRIRYVATPGRLGDTGNCAFLWNEARYDLLAYLLDDDLLMPHGLAEMLVQSQARPDASFYFGHRYIIDAGGRILSEPQFLASDVVALDQARMAATLVGGVRNPVGEFSNILINRAAGVTADDFVRYMGIDMQVCGDVAFYLNATRVGPAIGIKRPVAAFRRHGQQQSSPSYNPMFALGICEWELFIRGEYDAGRLPQPLALAAIDKLDAAYANWGRDHPSIGMMTPGLKALRGRVAGGETGVLDEAFRVQWQTLVDTVRAQKAASLAGS